MNIADNYKQRWSLLKKKYHTKCIFDELHSVIGKDLQVRFDNKGLLAADFFCHERYQGFNGIMHGGVLSALLDATMAQCLFGHGVVAYTTHMNIKYHTPVKLRQNVTIRCEIKEVYFNKLYKLQAEMFQKRRNNVIAHANFYRIN